MITQQRLKEVLKYHPGSGNFIWRVRIGGRSKIGSLAGSRHPEGYWAISVDGRSYLAHRLAWLYMIGEFPDTCLTHGNQQRADNSWDNILQTAQIYAPISYKKAYIAMLNTRIGKLEASKELAQLELDSMMMQEAA